MLGVVLRDAERDTKVSKTQAHTGGATDDAETLKTGSGLSRAGERAAKGPTRRGGRGGVHQGRPHGDARKIILEPRLQG